MRRKLITFDAFDQIEKNSLNRAAYELQEAGRILADVLNENLLELHSYDCDNVYYETDEGTFVHAQYDLSEGYVNFNHIEEVVIDEDSHRNARRDLLKNMVESLSTEDEHKAGHFFGKFIEMAMPKMKYAKGFKDKSQSEKIVSNAKSNMLKSEAAIGIQGAASKDPKKRQAAIKGHRKNPRAAELGWRKRKRHKSKIDAKHNNPAFQAAKKRVDRLQAAGAKRARVAGQRIEEWAVVSENVLEYVDIRTSGPIVESIKVQQDKLQNVVSVSVPNTMLRTEGKILALKWDTLKTDVKVLREQALRLANDEAFSKSVARIKRLNNTSSDEQLTSELHQLVAKYPTVLYLTQDELAKTVGEALTTFGTSNFDDTVCSYIAEGILRTAFVAYPERVNRLATLAKAPKLEANQDQYIHLQQAFADFFPQVDDQAQAELKVFNDLSESLNSLKDAAAIYKNEMVQEDALHYLEKVQAVLEGQERPSLTLAEEIAAYLNMIVESNIDGEEWKVTKRPYRTTVGEHPDMVSKAKQPYTPSKDFTDAGDAEIYVSDGEKYKGNAKSNRTWGSEGGKDVYPSVTNPYLPKEGDWTMKGEKGVDKDTNGGLAQWQSSDTWPNIDNPYLPKAVQVHVNNDNRVDDTKAN